MYLYLGQDTVVQSGDIIGIFDLENTSTSKITKHFLSAAQRSGYIREVSQELPKSFILCEKTGVKTVYLSQVSPSTLKKRARHIRNSLNK